MKYLPKKVKKMLLKCFISVKMLIAGVIFLLFPTICNATVYYVDISGNDDSTGISQIAAWRTISHAGSIAVAGDTVYIKAGNYSHEHVVIANSGNSSNQIVFEGYKIYPGDNPQLNYVPGDSVDYNIMPLLNGEDLTGTAIYLSGKEYIVIKNIQIKLYETGIDCLCNHVTLNNIIGIRFGAAGSDYVGRGILVTGNYCNILNCIITDAGAENYGTRGDYNYMENCKSYGVVNENATDYYMHFGGNYNIIKNCFAHRTAPMSHGGHGIGFKGNCSYNKVIDCEARYFSQDFLVRHSGCHHNEFINCTAVGVNGYVVRDGAHDNTFKNCRSKDTDAAILFYDTSEDGNLGSGSNNAFENCIFENSIYCIGFIDWVGGYKSNADSNIVKNCIFANADTLFWGQEENYDNNNNIIRNCIVTNVNAFKTGAELGFGISYSDFNNNSFGTPSGIGNLSLDPLFADTSDYHLKSQYGRWNGTTWVNDTITSPCINAGYPLDSYANEPVETGGPASIDIGRYGNTSEASKKYPLNTNQAPVAVIDSIIPNIALAGSAIHFYGKGTDADGTIASYEWYSSIDSLFCTSEDTTHSGLSIGTHTIIFRVQDNIGAFSPFDTSTLVIIDNYPPIAVIDNITPNPVTEGSPVSFTGTGTDTDGTVVAYEWSSDINGVFSTSEDPTYSGLNAETHTISFRVQDNKGTWSTPVTTTLVVNIDPSSLVANWHFDEGSDTIAYDASGNANSGTLKNSPAWVAGKLNSAINFADDYVDVPASASLNTTTNKITLSAWIKASPNANTATIIDRWLQDVNQRAYCLYLSGAGTISFGLSSSGNKPKTWITTTASIPRDTWTYITATFDGKTMKIYIDGVLSKSGAAGFSTIFSSTENIHIGKWHDNTTTWIYPFIGVIDEVRIYNTALPAVEIQNLYSITTHTEKIINESTVTCYPNPFTSEVNINYVVPRNGKVMIDIYSFTGQLVSKVVNENQTAGKYSTVWNPGKLANGPYICKVTINGNTTTSRIMLMR